jgi:hypothetical protein
MRDWVGPFSARQILERCMDKSIPRCPESGSAYLVSRCAWISEPTLRCQPLYVGGNTGSSSRFYTRIGDLLADLFGFFTDETGHHSGGQSLHRWCRENHVDPLRLYLAWVRRCTCHHCLEIDLVRELSPALNRKAPARCPNHAGSLGAPVKRRPAPN